MSISDARKEHEDGSAIRHSKATIAGGMSGCPRDLRPGAAAFDHLYGALRCDLLPPSTRSAGLYLYLWPALGCGTQKYRINRVSLWTRPPAPATLHWLGSLGGCALPPGVDAPSRRALGTRRWCVGVRSLGLSQVWHRVGGRGPAVVWPARQGRQLSGGRLPGLRVGRGPYAGRHAAVSAQSMDHGPGPPGQSWRAHRPPRGSLATTRGGVRMGFVAGSMAWVSALGWRCRAIR